MNYLKFNDFDKNDLVESKFKGKKWKGRFATIIDNVLSENECEYLIKYIEQQNMLKATLNNGTLDETKRNCLRLMIDDKILGKILYERIKDFVPNEPYIARYNPLKDNCTHPKWKKELNERLRFLKYENGHFMDDHRDGIFNRIYAASEGEKEDKCMDDFDMSFYTTMFYLNEGFEGGETIFLKRSKNKEEDDKIYVKPKIGRCLIFQHNLRHKANVLSGDIPKYAIRSDVMFSNDK